jgi:predicted aspartyl protease
MPVTVNYANNKKLIGASLKPVADIVLIGPKGKFAISALTVDTGADYLMVPQSAATRIGWLPNPRATSVTVATAGGYVAMTLLPAQSVQVEGILINTEVLVDPKNGNPLLGRSALQKLLNVGLNLTDWLW